MLAVALLLFGWGSVAIAAARRAQPPVPLAVPGGQDARIGAASWIRAAAGLLAGGCAVLIAAAVVNASPFAGVSSSGASGWLVLALIVAAAVAGIAALVILDLAARLVVSRFPAIGDWALRPLNWRHRRQPARAAAPNGVPGNGNGAARDNDGQPPAPPPLTADEILTLDHNDIDMVRSISRMDNRDAADIMVPRLDVDAVAASATPDEVVAKFVASRHTRLPVYRETMDDVIGVVHISDALLAMSSPDPATALIPASIMREPEFVAENTAVDDLLALLRRKSLQMVIVVDEFGGVEGIITLEDVLEEIVGEITDEFTEPDSAEPALYTDGQWTLNATMTLDDLSRAAGITLEHGDVNTVGGFVYTRLGRMPAVGDLVYADTATIEVTQVDGRRIQQVRLRVADGSGAASDGGADGDGNGDGGGGDVAAHRKRAAK